MTISEIIALVKKCLNDLSLNYTIQVLPEGVREENDWWFVPVQADPEPSERWRYYGDLLKVENAIETDKGIRVLLVPAS